MNLCKCGCGNEVTKETNTYLNGHSNRGLKPNLGSKRSAETKERMRIAAINRNKNPNYIQKLKDNHWSTKDEHRDRCCDISKQHMIENNPMKKPEVVKQAKKMYKIKYRNIGNRWRMRILKRDNYVCQECGLTNMLSYQIFGCRLDVHHIDYNSQNNDDSNGISLCHSCHSRTTTHNKQYWIDYYTNRLAFKIWVANFGKKS